MAFKIRQIIFNTTDDARREFSAIGVDPAGFDLMLPKAFFLNMKVTGLSAPAALILKQEMLSLGGDCANHRLVLKNEIKTADAILMGTVKVFQKLIPKLEQQAFGLKGLAVELRELLNQQNKPAGFKLNFKNQTLDLAARTHIMGILNITPDSFSDGGKFLSANQALEHGIKMVADGADMIDLGAESTRPGAEPISENEELDRLLPVLLGLKKEVAVPLSVDTYKAGVAAQALQHGADLINDISGLRFDPEMKNVVARAAALVIIMHIKGEPKNMQQQPDYQNLMDEIYAYLGESIGLAVAAGIKKENIIVDPGIGFGKRLLDNYEILRRLAELKSLGCPILIGPSRKSFIGKILDLPPEQRLEGTAAAVAIGIQNGAHLVRVHDVAAMKRVCSIADLLKGG